MRYFKMDIMLSLYLNNSNLKKIIKSDSEFCIYINSILLLNDTKQNMLPFWDQIPHYSSWNGMV